MLAARAEEIAAEARSLSEARRRTPEAAEEPLPEREPPARVDLSFAEGMRRLSAFRER